MKKIFVIIFLCTVFFSSCGQKETVIRMATYNLRLDTPYDSLNAWQYRKDHVKALIVYHDFDIVGTQEGFLHQLNDLCELPGYAYTGAGRDDGKEKGEHSAILYKTNRFDVLSSGNFWLSETPDVPGKGWDATCCNRICSWAKFRDKRGGREFYVFNVHFDHEGVVARRESGKLMVQKIGEIAKDAPVICTGDFNSTEDTEQIKTLSSFLQDSRLVSETSPYGPPGTFNGRFGNPVGKHRIDYIFVGSRFRVSNYATLTDNNGEFYPSDHLPVAAELSWR